MSSSKIKDLVEVVPAGSRSRSKTDSLPAELATFLMSYEVGDVVARTVERLAGSADGPRNCLVVGGPGCGKSRLVETVGALLEVPTSAPLHPRLAAVRASIGTRQTLVVRVPPPTDDRRLAAVVERAMLTRLAAANMPHPSEEIGARLELLAKAVGALPAGHRVVIILDNLDQWLDTAARYALENAQTLVRLGELSYTLPIAVCAAAGEYVLTHESGSGGQGWIVALVDAYRIEYVPARALRTATASNVLVKNARQRRDIHDVLGRLREKLPDLECNEEEFIELYPLEISTWNVGGHLHRWIEGFSFPDFAARAAESVKRRPAESLFALNDMFTLYEPQLRHLESLEASFAAYDRLVGEALPRLGQQQRLWGRLALQAIFMHTLAGIAADVKTLTNSVLLYDLHGGASSYAMMSAVLKQLESLGRGQIVASGEGSARRYNLVTGEREALLVLIDDMADAVEDEEEAAWALLGVGSHLFADWPFAASGPEGGRLDLWEIEQLPGRISIETRSLEGRDTGELGEQPRLVIFSPGRPWSEASDAARRHTMTACWIGAVPTPPERLVMRRWLAASRLASSERGKRYPDLPAILEDFEAQAVDVFRRIYVDGGAIVTAGSSEGVAELVSASREENLVVRFLPAKGKSPVARAAGGLNGDAVWVARLLADDPEGTDAVAARLDAEGWSPMLQAWYGARVGRDDGVPIRLIGERGAQIPEIAEALDAKQLFDVAVYYVRRSLASGMARGLGDAIAKVFETPERLVEARTRLAWLEGFADWVLTLERARVYLHNAETVADVDVEALHESLLEWTARLEEFVDEPRREGFERSFAAYREEYATLYAAVHEAWVGPERVNRMSDEIVTSPSWRILEAFSSLSIADPSYLVDAINLISALRETQCTADVDAALREASVCTCGFRFADRERVDDMAARAREFVETGIDFHRRLLQARRNELRDRIIVCKSAYDMDTIRSIAELTKDGPLPPVDARTIETLNALLARDDEWSKNTDPEQSLVYQTKRM